MAKYAAYQFTATDEEGNVLPLASVTVRSYTSGNPLASLKSDRAGTSNLGNPFTADSEGFARFYVVGGTYRVTVTLGAVTRVWEYVGVGTAQEYDANNLLFALPVYFSASDKPGAGEVLYHPQIGLTGYIPESPTAYGYAGIAATSQQVFNLQINGVTKATATIEASGATFAIANTAGADVNIAADDQITLVCPNPRDDTLADINLTFLVLRS